MAHGGYRPEDGIHVLHSYEYADSTARLAASGFRSVDVGKVARQQNDGSFWVLTDEAPITWLQLVAGTSGITALSGDAVATGPGAVTIVVTGLQSEPVSATTPTEGDVLTFLSGIWTPSAPGGGGGSLQDAYDLGADITQDLEGITIAQGLSAPADTHVLRLNANLVSLYPSYALIAQRSPPSPGGTGSAAAFYGGTNLTEACVEIANQGSGNALSVSATGSGPAALFDTTGGTGSGVSITVAAGANPLQASIGGANALTIDATNILVDIGSPAAPLAVIGHSVFRLGSGAGASAKSFDVFTTDVGTDPIATNNMGRLFTRAGAGSVTTTTIAELAYRPGSGAEVLLTKNGALFAQALYEEVLIANAVTVAAGNVVAWHSTAEQCVLADATDVDKCNIIGVAVIGGVGNGTNVYALIATHGRVGGLSGLTVRKPLYLSDSTPGLATTTVPSASGAYMVRLGVTRSTTSASLTIGEAIGPLP